MKTIKNWRAFRSGAGITVEGIDCDTDRSVRFSNIGEIAPRDGKLVVRDNFAHQDWVLAL